MELALFVVLCLILAGGLLWMFRRATARTDDTLRACQEQHARALRFLLEHRGSASFRLVVDGDGWAALSGHQGGFEVHLEATQVLSPDTKFIDHVTRLTVLAPAGRRFRLARRRIARLSSAAQEQLARDLAIPRDLSAEIAEVAATLDLSPEALALTARSDGQVIHRYSYGVHLMLDPDRLSRFLELTLNIAARLELESL